MKVQFLDTSLTYDGSQLRSLFVYEQTRMAGDGAIAFLGPCAVTLDKMKDAEDRINQEVIAGDQMLHFLVEVFDRPLLVGVLLQRILASLVQDWFYRARRVRLERDGDDLYFVNKGEKLKLSISIAAPAVRSSLVHFAVNVRNSGTPVPTAALEDFQVDPKAFASDILQALQTEWLSSLDASWKAFP